MKKYRWHMAFGLALLLASATLYTIHFLIFRNSHHISIFLLGDIAFVPVEVLMVTLVIHEVLIIRDKKAMLYKLNMAIGVFFGEVGSELLRQLLAFDNHAEALRREFAEAVHWKDSDYDVRMEHYLEAKRDMSCQSREALLWPLRSFLISERMFLLSLLENANLLEHESFTDLLWAVFHLEDELASREEGASLAQQDMDHLAVDMQRVYGLLIAEWLAYMKHLKNEYPYLHSLASRKNPFVKNASAYIGGRSAPQHTAG